MKVANLIFDKEGMPLPDIEWKDIYKEGSTIIEEVKERIDTIPIIVQDAIEVAGNTSVIGQTRETFALLKSLLISADWEGSSGKEIHSTVYHKT